MLFDRRSAVFLFIGGDSSITATGSLLYIIDTWPTYKVFALKCMLYKRLTAPRFILKFLFVCYTIVSGLHTTLYSSSIYLYQLSCNAPHSCCQHPVPYTFTLLQFTQFFRLIISYVITHNIYDVPQQNSSVLGLGKCIKYNITVCTTVDGTRVRHIDSVKFDYWRR